MSVRVIGFIPPVVGVDGVFNTFRLGGFYAKHLLPDETVYLLDERMKIVFGRAKVISVTVGPLLDMCDEFGHENHTELGSYPFDAPSGLMKTILKIYGPHIAKPTSKTTVIKLERIAWQK